MQNGSVSTNYEAGAIGEGVSSSTGFIYFDFRGRTKVVFCDENFSCCHLSGGQYSVGKGQWQPSRR